MVLELTERALASKPADVLTAVAAARRRGWGIAIDDVGAHPDSLALMLLLQSDVVKLDMALVQKRATLESGRISAAVASYAEEVGAMVVCEGIETEEHLHGHEHSAQTSDKAGTSVGP